MKDIQAKYTKESFAYFEYRSRDEYTPMTQSHRSSQFRQYEMPIIIRKLQTIIWLLIWHLFHIVLSDKFSNALKKNASNVIVKRLNTIAHYTHSINEILSFLMDCIDSYHKISCAGFIFGRRQCHYSLRTHITYSSIIITTCERRTIANNLGFNFNIVEENVRLRWNVSMLCRRNDALLFCVRTQMYYYCLYALVHKSLQQFAIIHRDLTSMKYSMCVYKHTSF